MERLKTHQENVKQKAKIVGIKTEEELKIEITIRCSKCETLFIREFKINKKATKQEITRKAEETRELFYYKHVIKCGEQRK